MLFHTDTGPSLKRKNHSIQLEPPVPSVNSVLLRELGINEARFQGKFARLLRNWWDSGTAIHDCDGKRFMQAELFNDLQNPLKLVIVADNVELFSERYQNNKNQTVFDLCCLCGSQKILNEHFLNSERDRSYLIESDNAIAYTLSTGNHEFALRLAQEAKKLGRTEPGPIALYSFNMETLFFSKEIKNVFSEPSMTGPINVVSTNKLDSSLGPEQQMFEPIEGNEMGKIAAKRLLNTTEFGNFLKTADSEQLEAFFQTIQIERENFSAKRQKIS